jgi:hypothetical protein
MSTDNAEIVPSAAPGLVYVASTIRPKRVRRTKAAITDIRTAIYEIVKANQPMTVRQVFYACVVADLIDKTEAEYNRTIGRLLTEMRRAKVIPYSWISDNTRWMRKPTTYDSIKSAVEATAKHYRRNLWIEAPVYVEIWCEKEALAGVLIEETQVYDVPLMVARGFASESYLYSAAEKITAVGRPTYIYQLGDHDPSGVWIARTIESGLRRMAPDAEIHFERIAVTPDQITAMSLPTRPTKRDGNTHAKNFAGDSVELDAIPPLELRRLCREAIERHVDKTKMQVLLTAEQSEREFLTSWAKLCRGIAA